MARPTQLLTNLLLKNALCPQSCWIRNIRTKNIAPSAENGSDKNTLMDRAHHAKHQIATSGTSVTNISNTLRLVSGSRNSTRTLNQSRAVSLVSSAATTAVGDIWFIRQKFSDCGYKILNVVKESWHGCQALKPTKADLSRLTVQVCHTDPVRRQCGALWTKIGISKKLNTSKYSLFSVTL